MRDRNLRRARLGNFHMAVAILLGATAAALLAPTWRSALAPVPTTAKQALNDCLKELAWPDDVEVPDIALLSVPLTHHKDLEAFFACADPDDGAGVRRF